MTRKAKQEGKPVKLIRVGWTLPEDLVKQLRILAVEQGRHVSVLAQEAVEQYVKGKKKL